MFSSASAGDIYHPSIWHYDLLEFVDDQETPQHLISNFNKTLKSEVNSFVINSLYIKVYCIY